MANPDLEPVKLVPERLSLREVEEIADWPYATEPFYIDQVKRSLSSDIPLLMIQGICVTWGYHDVSLNFSDKLIGVGVLQMSSGYFEVTDRKQHCYIPLLGIRPDIVSKGYGGSIVSHLVQQAEKTVRQENRSELKVYEHLFLDVYTENEKAIHCYQREGFRIINESDPFLDEDENNAPYYVMTKELNYR